MFGKRTHAGKMADGFLKYCANVTCVSVYENECIWAKIFKDGLSD